MTLCPPAFPYLTQPSSGPKFDPYGSSQLHVEAFAISQLSSNLALAPPSAGAESILPAPACIAIACPCSTILSLLQQPHLAAWDRTYFLSDSSSLCVGVYATSMPAKYLFLHQATSFAILLADFLANQRVVLSSTQVLRIEALKSEKEKCTSRSKHENFQVLRARR